MVNTCSAYGCNGRYKKGFKLFRFPRDEIRRQQWIRAVKRENWQPSKTSCLCEKHFQTGRPSRDKNHPDYVPNVFIFNEQSRRSAETYEKRKLRLEKYRGLLTNSDADAEGTSSDNMIIGSPDSAMNAAAMPLHLSASDPSFPCCNSCLCKDAEIDYMKNEREKLLKEVEMLKTEVAMLREEAVEQKKKMMEKDEINVVIEKQQRLKFYTGLASKNIFQWLLNVCSNVDSAVQAIPPERQLLLVLMKLRQNFDAIDLAYRFGISKSTVSRIFKRWIPYMGNLLKCLIRWPDLCLMRQNLPHAFQNSLYRDAICIIDCTEVFIEKPGNQKARAATWSSYKHQHTMKFLVAVTPTGNVCFLSNSWGGRASDRVITLRSDFLENLKAGDVVLADRGFTLEEYFAAVGAHLITPSFIKKKKQLSKLNVVRSKMISNVRILVERVIGHLKKFKILDTKIPISFLKYVDPVITICAALHNLSPPIIK